MSFQCSGTAMCDESVTVGRVCKCAVRVVYTASIQQVADGIVRIAISGCVGDNQNVEVRHSSTIPWDPAWQLREQQKRETNRTAAVKLANEGSSQLLYLRAKLIESQRLDLGTGGTAPAEATPTSGVPLVDAARAGGADGAMPTAHWAPRPTASATATLQVEVAAKQQEVKRNKRKTHDSHPKVVRDEILRLHKLGIDPAKIQAELQLSVCGGSPHLSYIHTVVNNERRRMRMQMPAFEAVDWMCRKVLAGQQRVILYHVADPAILPEDYAHSPAPPGAMYLVVCSTMSMISRLQEACGLGLDTKWRTNETGNCLLGIGAFTEQTSSKESETRRVEFEAGYVGHKYSTVTLTLSNLDNYWCHAPSACTPRAPTHPVVRMHPSRSNQVWSTHLRRVCPSVQGSAHAAQCAARSLAMHRCYLHAHGGASRYRRPRLLRSQACVRAARVPQRGMVAAFRPRAEFQTRHAGRD